uniref:Uncharacterized protein n=1 Tax=Candidatus Kentrum eta TaxID=2126337 RepID=A0A450VJA8_9GAMM|nr:MAG: hypothetical protein BECKH772B_GA0070898_105022 [Candidatus Kentron sp. H]VFK05139.1 MAG: hypothetical protein BECKH772A_GA0070896_105082 [Candidatus Kentron sp. H]VFK08378.1 MAG: hypothetical protein BECKH772C_GA0070978_105062 [Candidatus Kentron sp. H]
MKIPMLFRQYFPKGGDFTTITHEEIQSVMDKLNNRPRKCLGMNIPDQVFFNINPIVAQGAFVLSHNCKYTDG